MQASSLDHKVLPHTVAGILCFPLERSPIKSAPGTGNAGLPSQLRNGPLRVSHHLPYDPFRAKYLISRFQRGNAKRHVTERSLVMFEEGRAVFPTKAI